VLTQSVNALRLAVEQRPPPHADADDESVHGDSEGIATASRSNGRGNGHPIRGRGFVPLGTPRVPVQQDDGLGKPKFSIPRFEGGPDVEEYDTDQRDPKGVWPNLSRRSNKQQDNNKRIKFETDQIKPS
jgi:hypothetical protein